MPLALRHSPLFILLLFLPAFGVLAAQPARDQQQLTAARQQLTDPKTVRRGIRTLKHLCHSRNPQIAPLAAAALAHVLGKKSKQRKALFLLLKPYAAPAANLSFPRIEAFIANLHLLAIDGHLDQALQQLKIARVRAPDGLPAVLLLETRADFLVTRNQLPPARDAFRQALDCGNAWFKRRNISKSTAKVVLSPPKPHADEWPRIRNRLEQKLKKLERQLRILKFGLDYVLYQDARTQQAANQIDLARKTCDALIKLFPRSIYAEAARFYRCSLTPTIQTTRKELRTFIQQQPDGLYRGEALLTLANFALSHDWTSDPAEKAYRETVAWCQRIRRQDRAVRQYLVPKKSRAISAPPPKNKRIDRWGIIHKITIPPDKLLNRLTAKWYLNDLELQARYGLTFCLMNRADWKSAQKQVDRLLDLDPAMRQVNRQKKYTTWYRLNNACKLKKIRRDAPLLAPFSPSRRLKLQFADFRYLDRDFTTAQRLYRELLDELRANHGGKAQQSLVLASLGSIAYMQKDRKAATRFYDQAFALSPDSPTGAQSAFCLANLAISGDSPRYAEALKMYRHAERYFPASMPLARQNSIACRIQVLLLLDRRGEARVLSKKLLALNPVWQQSVNTWFKYNWNTAARFVKNKTKKETP